MTKMHAWRRTAILLALAAGLGGAAPLLQGQSAPGKQPAVALAPSKTATPQPRSLDSATADATALPAQAAPAPAGHHHMSRTKAVILIVVAAAITAGIVLATEQRCHLIEIDGKCTPAPPRSGPSGFGRQQ